MINGDWGRYLSGADIPITECGIALTQPTILQIEQVGEMDFLYGVSCFAQYEKIINTLRQGNTELEEVSDFQLLLEVINTSSGAQMKKGVDILFSLCLPRYEVQWEEDSIVFLEQTEKELVPRGRVHGFNFDVFSAVIKDLFADKSALNKEDEYNPANEKAKEIADKIQKGKEKIAKQKGEKVDKEVSPGSLYGTMISILSVGVPYDINALYNYTPFQLMDAFTRYMAKVASDQYERISLVPLMDTSKIEAPEPWMRSLY